MGAAARDFAISYGSYLVGTGSSPSRPITGKLRMERSMTDFTCEFEYVVRGDTPAAFLSEITAAELAFTTKFQPLIITVGTGDTRAQWYNFDTTSNANFGFDAEATILKTADAIDTALSRKYTVRVKIGLPADKLGSGQGRMGRRESTVSVAYSESRRRVITISGTYTGAGTNGNSRNARTQYEQTIDAYAAAVLSNIDGAAKFEVVGEPLTEIDDTVDTGGGTGMGRVCRFTRVYQEIIFEQVSKSVLDDPRIVNQKFKVTRRRAFPGDAPGARRLEYFDVSYSGSVRAHALQGASSPVNHVDYETALQGFYDNNIRPFLIDEAQGNFAAKTQGAIAVIEETTRLDLDDNRIEATMVIAVVSSGKILEATMTIEDSLETGATLVPTYNPNPLFKYRYQGPARRLRTITTTKRVVGTIDDKDALNDIPKNGTNFVVLKYTKSQSPVVLGAKDLGNTIQVTDLTTRTEMELYVPFGGSSIGPGGTTSLGGNGRVNFPDSLLDFNL